MLLALQAFEAALENEDYELASNLRDRAGVGLCGWWACSKGDEPAGHLLWVEPAFGRFVGTYFSARELAELTVRLVGSGSAEPLLSAASREWRPSPAAIPCFAVVCMAHLQTAQHRGCPVAAIVLTGAEQACC